MVKKILLSTDFNVVSELKQNSYAVLESELF